MAEKTVKKTDAQVVAIRRNDIDWRQVSNWNDYLAVTGLAKEDIAVAADELGDGFELIESSKKITLCGVPLIFVDWTFATSDDYVTKDGEPGEYVFARVLTRDGRRVKFTDGGVGICRQLKEYTMRNEGRAEALICSGLRPSDYDFVDANGNPGKGRTYYIDTTPLG